MSTSLYLITNTKLTGNETKKDWDLILEKLKQLNFETTSYTNANFETIKETGDWRYEFDGNEADGFPFHVEFLGPFAFFPSIYSNIGVIDTIYRYSVLYDFVYYGLDWFDSYRKNLYEIVKIMGGTEVIYLADNICVKLSYYLDCMALENVAYEEIKQKMIEEMGLPITDYTKLNRQTFSYETVNEFFLDDFADLKKGTKY